MIPTPLLSNAFRARSPLFLHFLALIALSSSAWGSTEAYRVVLDPGHGGQDLGAVFEQGNTKLSEKDITLALAKATERELRERGIEVILTREQDYEVSLAARTAIANRWKADLFISIHMNSIAKGHAHTTEGVETYILNTSSDASSHRLAELENSIIAPMIEGEQTSDVALILKDLRLDANLSESKRLACLVQDSLVKATRPTSRKAAHTRNRGVKQALFHVLLGADMPSVLLEAGFITHPRDRAYVTQEFGKKRIGSAVAQAVENYFLLKQKKKLPSLLRLSSCQIH